MLISLLVVLVIVGVLVYLLQVMVPMDQRIRSAIIAIILLFAFLYVVAALTGRDFTHLVR